MCVLKKVGLKLISRRMKEVLVLHLTHLWSDNRCHREGYPLRFRLFWGSNPGLRVGKRNSAIGDTTSSPAWSSLHNWPALERNPQLLVDLFKGSFKLYWKDKGLEIDLCRFTSEAVTRSVR